MPTFCLIFLLCFILLFGVLAFCYIRNMRKSTVEILKTRLGVTVVKGNIPVKGDLGKPLTPIVPMSRPVESIKPKSYFSGSRSNKGGSGLSNNVHGHDTPSVFDGIGLGATIGLHSHSHSSQNHDKQCSPSSSGDSGYSSSSDSGSSCSGGSYD